MKKILMYALTSLIMLGSCKKKDTNSGNGNSVTIQGKSYNTAKISTLTWTIINYNGIGGVNYDNASGDFPLLGKLYTYDEAKSIILPEGWRLPTIEDYKQLMISQGAILPDQYGNLAVGVDIAKKFTTRDWSNVTGNNLSGFGAVITGYYSNGLFIGKSIGEGGGTGFWTNSSFDSNFKYVFGITNYELSIVNFTTEAYIEYFDKSNRYPIRFVKNT